jgi:hypothetical protein
MARGLRRGTVDADADTTSARPGGTTMQHPETLRHLVRERQERYLEEAHRDRLVRDLTSVQHEQPRDRFRIRDLRWILFRPANA